MKLTTRQLRNIIKEELAKVVENDDVVPGGPQYEEDPPHGSVRARWSGTPEKGIVELEDGTTIVVPGGTDLNFLQSVENLLADKGIKSIHDSVNMGAPEEVLDFLKTKHLAGNITEDDGARWDPRHPDYEDPYTPGGRTRPSKGQLARREKEEQDRRAKAKKTN